MGTLQDIGFEQCLVAPCVLRLQEDGKVVVMVVVHVDDIVCATVLGTT